MNSPISIDVEQILVWAWILASLLYIVVSNWPGSWVMVGTRKEGVITRFSQIVGKRKPGIVHVNPVFSEKMDDVDMRGNPMSIPLRQLTTGVGRVDLPERLKEAPDDPKEVKLAKMQEAARLSRPMTFGVDLEAVIQPKDSVKFRWSLRTGRDPKTGRQLDAADVMAQFLQGTVQSALNQMTGNVFLSGTLPEFLRVVEDEFKKLTDQWGGETTALTIKRIIPPPIIIEATEIEERGNAEAARMRALSAAEIETAADQIRVEGEEIFIRKEQMDNDREIAELYAEALKMGAPHGMGNVLVLGNGLRNAANDLIAPVLKRLKAGGNDEHYE